jgi:peptide/nickel transport system permease protein
MQRYILHRLLLGIVTLFMVSLLVFVMVRIAPGDVAMMIAAQGQEEGADIPEEVIQEIRDLLGLDRPLPLQYVEWMRGAVTLNWGESYFSGFDIFEEMRRRFPVTLELAFLSIIIAMAIGLPLGVLMALKQDTWLDYVARIFSLAGLSVPNFWSATLIIAVGMLWFNWAPRIEYVSPLKDPLGNLSLYFWPSMTLGWIVMATQARMLRSSMLEVLRQDYIRTARAKGLTGFVVTYRHVLRNAMLPVVTIVSFSVIIAMGGSVITEQIFNLPGMGQYLVQAMSQRDYPVVQTVVLFFAAWVVFVNLAMDLLYAWLDPRIRYN